MADHPLDSLRRLCTAFPQVEERLSHGEPAWFFRGKKLFVMYADHHHDDRVAFWCAAPAGVQALMVEASPEKFFIPPYVGGRGWLGVYLDREVDWEEIEGIVEAAYGSVSRSSGRSVTRKESGSE